MRPPSDDVVFNTEAMKLLLQVAWADDVLDPLERQFVATVGAAWRVPEPQLSTLLSHLDQGKPLPQPNLALLRQRADAVIDACEALVAADGVIDALEQDFLKTVEQLLGKN